MAGFKSVKMNTRRTGVKKSSNRVNCKNAQTIKDNVPHIPTKSRCSVDDDNCLRMAVSFTERRFGTLCWSRISQMVPGMTSKQCRERWCNHVDPTIDKSQIVGEELIEINRMAREKLKCTIVTSRINDWRKTRMMEGVRSYGNVKNFIQRHCKTTKRKRSLFKPSPLNRFKPNPTEGADCKLHETSTFDIHKICEEQDATFDESAYNELPIQLSSGYAENSDLLANESLSNDSGSLPNLTASDLMSCESLTNESICDVVTGLYDDGLLCKLFASNASGDDVDWKDIISNGQELSNFTHTKQRLRKNGINYTGTRHNLDMFAKRATKSNSCKTYRFSNAGLLGKSLIEVKGRPHSTYARRSLATSLTSCSISLGWRRSV